MALLKFLKGNYSNLNNAAIAEGQILICNDTAEMFVDVASDKRIKIGDFTVVANIAALEALDATAVPTSRLYYVEDGNILARSNGTAWIQVNKQKTAEEMKTFLGLGSLAYLSEVGEANLDASLKEKVNAASGAQHSHANKELLDTYTQTEANLADAVAKKHAHANADELAKIVDGDKAKWDAVVADHLTSADKTTLENSIKDAKKAGTDANTNIETYKVTNDARVLAVEEDIAEIVDGANGILAQAKSYADGKDSAIAEAKKAGTDANAALEAYKTSNNEALAGVKATADAAAVKTEVETALAGKVDKVEGKSLISDAEIARLANVNNYDDTQVKADIAKKADSATMTTELGKKVDKVEGYSLISNDEIARLAEVDNYDDAEVRGLIGDNADAIDTLAGKVGEVGEGQTVMGIIKNIQENAYDDAELRGLISDNAEAIEAINNAETGILRSAKDYADGIVAAEKQRAEGIEGGLRTDVDAIKGDYLKASDKTELQGNIDTVSAAVERLTNGVSAEEVDGVNDLIQYVKDHGTEVTGIKEDIKDNADAIAAINNESTGILKQAKDYADGLAGNYAEAEHDHVVADITDFDSAVKAYGYATTDYADGKASAAQSAAEATAAGALASARTEISAEIDADVKALADGQVKTNTEAIATKADAANVYAKSETLSKSEIEALFTWGSF